MLRHVAYALLIDKETSYKLTSDSEGCHHKTINLKEELYIYVTGIINSTPCDVAATIQFNMSNLITIGDYYVKNNVY